MTDDRLNAAASAIPLPVTGPHALLLFVGQVEEPAGNNGLPVCLFVPSHPVLVTVGLKKAWRSISLAFLVASGPV